jgi:hypothetical protein
MASKQIPESFTIEAKPYAFTFPTRHTALVVIDMQRDFLLAKGFGVRLNLSHETSMHSILSHGKPKA